MPDTAPQQAAAIAPQGLFARTLGVLTSPTATYAGVAARPRWLGVLGLTAAISGAAAAGFMATEVGRQAVVDQQITVAESYGRRPSQTQLDMIERTAPYLAYLAPLLQLASFLFGTLVVSGVAIAVFNAALDGNASFGQIFSVVAHSSVVLALQSLFTLPLDYARETLSSPTSIAVFLPFLDENTFPARLLGSIDLFLVWWTINLAIGLGVLYKRRTGPIAGTMLAVYATIALLVAVVKSALAGA